MNKNLLELLNKEQTDPNKIETWFDEIAKELLLNNVLKVNDIELEFIEIEFYFFKKEIHEDNYTHPHKMKAGKWRFHRGVDITFNSDSTQDGGILIRGIKNPTLQNAYVNGPINVLRHIGECWNNCFSNNCIEIIQKDLGNKEIHKIPRENLSTKFFYRGQDVFVSKKYRYVSELALNNHFDKIQEADRELLK